MSSSVSAPCTPPNPPGMPRLGNQTLEQKRNQVWGWFATMCAAFTLPLLPLSLTEIYSEATSSCSMPSWLQTGGSARSSCQKLYELIQGLDFRLRFSINQIADNFSWVRSQLRAISQAIRDLLRHLAKLEILIAVLDSSLDRLEQQVHQLLFQPMQARIKPKAKPRGSADKAPSKKRPSTFKQRVASRKKTKEMEALLLRLEYLEQRDAQHDILGRKFKAFAASLHEVEDQLDKQGIKIRRLNQICRNSERLLRQNGLLAEGEDMSKTSSSEMEWAFLIKKGVCCCFVSLSFPSSCCDAVSCLHVQFLFLLLVTFASPLFVNPWQDLLLHSSSSSTSSTPSWSHWSAFRSTWLTYKFPIGFPSIDVNFQFASCLLPISISSCLTGPQLWPSGSSTTWSVHNCANISQFNSISYNLQFFLFV